MSYIVTDEIRKKMSDSHKGKVQSDEIKIKRGLYRKGKENPRFGIKHSDESKVKIGLAGIGRKCSVETKNKQSIAHFGKKYKPMSKEGRLNLSIAMRGKKSSPATQFKKGQIPWIKGRKMSDEYRAKNSLAQINSTYRKFKRTSIEIKIEEELIKRNIDFKQNESVLGIANVDFLLSEYMIIIECDGCFWHGCPIHNPDWTERKERDAQKTRRLIEAGYKVFRFWEHEINKSPAQCVDSLAFHLK